MPSNNQPVAYGVSEACSYNDHLECRERGCRCDCHQKARAAADQQGVGRVTMAPQPASDLEKFCLKCQAKYSGDRNFCSIDGSRLSSLRCEGCGSVADPVDNFCGYCGNPMKGGERAEPTDQQIEEVVLGTKGLTDEASGSSADSLPADSYIESGIPDSVRARFGETEIIAAHPELRQPLISVGMFKTGG